MDSWTLRLTDGTVSPNGSDGAYLDGRLRHSAADRPIVMELDDGKLLRITDENFVGLDRHVDGEVVPHDAPDSVSITWARVQDDFYVGSLGGDFFGYVDRTVDGDFIASDLHAREVGRYPSLEAAARGLAQVAVELSAALRRERALDNGRTAI